MARVNDSHDYVVVGAGSAGCVLASRLSEGGERSVLLLEAGGPDEKREIDIPAGFSDLFQTEVDWNFHTAPQPELAERELYWPRGKVLGGSSSINAMIYVRGHPDDYDGWAEAGNEGWGWEEMLPYFKRAERNERFSDDLHGTGGPLNVADQRDPNELSETFVEAAAEVGHRRTDDFNDGTQEGVGLYQVTQKGGKRHSAAAAYLKPILERSNLEAVTHAHVTRVRFDGERAVGVEYEHEGERKRADAEEEVILCGGAVNSPQLLMLSGVGPADHLAEHGIDVVADRPGVGRNLQDHLNVGVVYECTEPISLSKAESLWNVAKYFLRKKGMLTSNVAEAGGFAKTDPDLDAPDVQFHFGPAYFVNHGFEEAPVDHAFSAGAVQLRPESRGRITLASADPLDDPVIDPQYLTEERDWEVLLDGLEMCREIARADAFAPYRGRELLPGEDAETREEMKPLVRERAETLYHPVGTCKMGNDDMAVVDDRLRVHDVSGLRVVDASIMPRIVRGNTNAPTIAIAEKAADVIRADA